jgi:hypothetical protein
MNIDDIDLEALQRDLDEYARQLRQRGWLRRNWLWFTPLVLILVVLLGVGGAYWALYARVHGLDVYQSAMQQIAADEAVQKSLGQPIAETCWPPPGARLETDEQDVRWPIHGPQGEAKAHVAARRMNGKMTIVQLEVVLADGKRLNVSSGGDTEADAPAFTGAASSSPKTESSGPPPEINLAPPSMDGTGK